MPCRVCLWIYRGSDERLARTQHRNDVSQSCQCFDKPRLQHIQICTDQQIYATAYHLQGITVPKRLKSSKTTCQ